MNRIKEIRIEKKLTQKMLAQNAKISQSVLSQYENGQVEPTATAIIDLCDALEVSSDYLLGRSDDLGIILINDEKFFRTNESEQNLILNYRLLRPDMKKIIVDMIKAFLTQNDNREFDSLLG